MIVFRKFFKILKPYTKIILIYVVIFALISVISSLVSGNSDDYTASKPRVVIVNNDKGSKLSKSFAEYISENAEIVEIEGGHAVVREALFFGKVHYAMVIPQNFGKSILEGNDSKIDIMKSPSSTGMYSQMLANRYLNTVSVYAKAGMNEDKLLENVNKDLRKGGKVKIESRVDTLEIAKARTYFDMFSYIMLVVVISVISFVLSSFNDRRVKRRNIIAPVSHRSINFQIFLGNSVLVMGIWLVLILLPFFLYMDVMLTMNGLLFILNSFIFSIMSLSLGLLIGNLGLSRNVNTAIVNIITLASSFLCGAFVPQKFLGDFTVKISKVFPSYWFIKNNWDIEILTSFNFEDVKGILMRMGVVLAFAILFFVVLNIVSMINLKKED